MTAENIEKIWYRQPYVWLIIAFPLAAVIGGIITIWIAIKSDDGLVVDDYYKRGLEINLTLERDRIAKQYDLRAALQVNHEDNRVLLTLIGNEKFSPPEQVSIQFLHATRGGFDQKLVLPKEKSGIYQGTLPGLIRGNWHIVIVADNWRILETLRVSE